jgi:hypothetical protein
MILPTDKFTFVYDDSEWTAVYQNGELLTCGHTIDAQSFCELLGITHEMKEHAVFDGWTPEMLENVKYV